MNRRSVVILLVSFMTLVIGPFLLYLCNLARGLPISLSFINKQILFHWLLFSCFQFYLFQYLNKFCSSFLLVSGGKRLLIWELSSSLNVCIAYNFSSQPCFHSFPDFLMCYIFIFHLIVQIFKMSFETSYLIIY